MSQHPSAEDLARWHRWFAIESNNEAWRLAEQGSRTPEENERMVHLAHAAALHWSAVGDDDTRARAWGLLAQAHALAGNGALAVQYAALNLDYVMGRSSADWEIAFAQIIMSNALHANGQRDEHRRYYELAQRSGEAIFDPEDKEIFMMTFKTALS
jgi:hypothetical protein